MSRREVVSGAGLLLSILAAGLLFTRSAPESYDAQIMYQVTQSMVDHANFVVHHDVFAMNSPYSSYGIGMSLLMAVPYFIAERLKLDPSASVMTVNAVVVALVALVIYRLGRAVGATIGQSLAAAAITAFGTALFAYVATGFSEPSVGLGIALGLLGVQTRRPVLVGAGAGLALLMRIDSALLVLPVLGAGAWIAGGRTLGAGLRYTAGLLPAILITGAYDTVRFGVPWRAGYVYATFNHPLLAGLYGLLLSPAAGLFLYVPLLPLALLGMWITLRHMPVVGATALVLLIVRIPFYAVWFGWQAYYVWGPRYLVPAMPVLAIGLLEIFRRWSGLRLAFKTAALTVVSVSCAVQLVGAGVEYEHAHMFAALQRAHPAPQGAAFIKDATTPSTEAIYDSVDFDWSLWPIPDEASDLVHGRYLTSHLLHPMRNLGAVAALIGVAAAAMAVSIASAVDYKRPTGNGGANSPSKVPGVRSDSSR